MFGKKLVPVWIGILCIASVFLMGQEPSCQVGPPAPVAKTGQTASYATGDDGDLQMGVVSPSPRFMDNADGTVTDNLTGLTWTKSGNCGGMIAWDASLNYCNGLAEGICGLNDSSKAGDWRLPNVRELQSLIAYANIQPPLPSGHPFTGVQLNNYWSSTTFANLTTKAWVVAFNKSYENGVGVFSKTSNYYTWCVKDGQ